MNEQNKQSRFAQAIHSSRVRVQLFWALICVLPISSPAQTDSVWSQPTAIYSNASDTTLRYIAIFRPLSVSKLASLESAFLSRYGASDSARAMIRYWFFRHKKYKFRLPFWSVTSAIGVGGVLYNAVTPTKGFPLLTDNQIYGGLFGLVAIPSVVMLGHTVINRAHFRIERLEPALLSTEQISNRRWREALRRFPPKPASDEAIKGREAVTLAQLRAKYRDIQPSRLTIPVTGNEAIQLQYEHLRRLPRKGSKPTTTQ